MKKPKNGLNSLASMIRTHRKKAGWSQKELAARAGLGKTVIFDLESGKTTVQLDTVGKVLAALDIQIILRGPLTEAPLSSQKSQRPSRLKIQIPHQKLASFCKKHQLQMLAFFGSVLTDRFSPESDVDVLIEFDPSQKKGFFELAEMEQELSKLLGKRKVDLKTKNELSRYFRDEVLRSAEVAYAA